MLALIKISWREVREGFTKFLLTLLSVSLGVAFLTGTLALRDTLANTFTDIVTGSNSGDIFVRGTVIEDTLGQKVRNSIDLDLEQKIRRAVGPDAVISPDFSLLNVRIDDADGNAISNAGAPTILMSAYDDPLWGKLVEGRFPKGPREMVMLPETMKAAGLNVGDTTKVTINGAKRDVTITGALDYNKGVFGAVLVFMDRDVVEPLALPDVKKIQQFNIYLPEGADANQAISAIAKEIPANAVVGPSSLLIKEGKEQIDDTLGFVNIFLLVFVFISLFVGSFVIGNTFAMTVRQRMKQFAMLRAIGTKPSGVFFLVLAQAVVIGILGSLLGLVLGMLLLLGVGAMFNGLGLPLATPAMSSSVMLIGVVVGIVVTVGGAFISARKAALTDPLEVLREAQGGERESYNWRNYLSAAVLVIGVILCGLGLDPANFQLIGAGATMVVFGVIGSLTFVVEPIVNAFARLLRPIAKVETNLAKGNLIRNRSRTTATAGALLIGVALISAGAMITNSVQNGATALRKTNLKADLFLASENGALVPKQIVDQVRELDDIEKIVTVHIGDVIMEHDGKKASRQVYYADAHVSDVHTHTVISGDDSALEDGKILVNQLRLADKDAFEVGDEVVIQTPYGKKTTEVGVIVDSPTVDFGFALPVSWINDLDPEGRDPFFVDVVVKDDADIETVKHDINALIDDGLPYEAKTIEDLEGASAQQFETILGILYALIGLSVITAIFGVINTLALSVMDRTREIGMSQAIGMRARELLTMITIESVLTTLLGTVIGILTGVGLAWVLLKGLATFGIQNVSIPYGTIGAVILGAIIVGVFAALLPARRAAKINVLSAMAE